MVLDGLNDLGGHEQMKPGKNIRGTFRCATKCEVPSGKLDVWGGNRRRPLPVEKAAGVAEGRQNTRFDMNPEQRWNPSCADGSCGRLSDSRSRFQEHETENIHTKYMLLLQGKVNRNKNPRE